MNPLHRHPHWTAPLLVALVLGAIPNAGAGQRAPSLAGIAGRVVDDRSGAGVPRALVRIITGHTDTLTTDAAGRFVAERLRPGAHVVEIAAIGYHAARWTVELTARTEELTFALEPRVRILDSIIVATTPDIVNPNDWRSPASFERRRSLGGGQFLTQEQISRTNARTLSDLLTMVPGVRVNCAGRTCQIQMMAGAPCIPEFFLDGAPASNSTGPTFPVVRLRGIEIYRAGDAPVEFARPGLRCGVVAMWSQ